MATLNNFMNLMPEAVLDFGFDSFIQVVSYSTGAHYRWNSESSSLEVGGIPIHCSIDSLLNRPIKCIEYIDGQCIISI